MALEREQTLTLRSIVYLLLSELQYAWSLKLRSRRLE